MPGFTRIGTTSPIYVPRSNESQIIRSGKDYFLVQIHAAQAAFKGSIWSKVNRLVIASSVAISRPGFVRENMKAIQRSRSVQPGHAVKLGLRSNLIALVPAVMTEFSISIEFIVDAEDRLKALAGIINDDNFLTAISLAPGAAMLAKTVGGLADKLMHAFLPDQERSPVLQFAGDFNLATEGDEGVRDGYYVILGTRDDESPLPPSNTELSIKNGELLRSGVLVADLSYVILDVQRVTARTRERNDGAAWEAKLREAEDEARLPISDEQEQAWTKCRSILRDAQAIMRTDFNYLRDEVDAILLSVMRSCKSAIFPEQSTRKSSLTSGDQGTNDMSANDLRDLNVAVEPSDISTVLDQYAEQVHASRKLFKELAL
jgi:hypothetical protein